MPAGAPGAGPRAKSSAATGGRSSPGGPGRPKPSSTVSAAQNGCASVRLGSLVGSSAGPVPGAVSIPAAPCTRRSSIDRNSPDSGSDDQSAFAAVWNRTTCPFPSASRVTSGVPSLSDARVRAARSGPGSAISWARTVTSAGGVSPAKGPSAAKGWTARGSPQLSAPPMSRPPGSSRTGSSGSRSSASDAAMRGPAKRISSPPRAIQSDSSGCSGSSGWSAMTITSGAAGRTSASAPSIRSVRGASAWRR